MTTWKDLRAKTVHILFFLEDELITRVRMRLSNFKEKILHELTAEEGEKWIPIPVEFETYTDREFIEVIWRICFRHGYVYKCDDILGTYLDKMRIITID